MNATDLIFNSNKEINSGGFSVESILMKSSQSPFITMNNNSPFSGGNNNNNTNQVSDIFNSLVVPNWALYNPNNLQKININTGDKDKNVYANEDDDKSDNDCIQDTLYDKLFNLANAKINDHEDKVGNSKTDISKKSNKGNKGNKGNKTKKIATSPNKSPKRKTKKRNKKGDNGNNTIDVDAK